MFNWFKPSKGDEVYVLTTKEQLGNYEIKEVSEGIVVNSRHHYGLITDSYSIAVNGKVSGFLEKEVYTNKADAEKEIERKNHNTQVKMVKEIPELIDRIEELEDEIGIEREENMDESWTALNSIDFITGEPIESETFYCDDCDFFTDSEKGLSIHKSKQHK